MNKTSIEYLDYTVNPLAMRCRPVSAGCENCWHLGMAKRFAKNPAIPAERRAAYAGGTPVLIEKELNAPRKLRKPAVIGVQFMGDLFHEDVSGDFLVHVMETIGEAPQHTFLILTKRPQRMRKMTEEAWYGHHIPNVWLGVSVENQETADERIPILWQIPAAVKFISYEPALGPLVLGDACEEWWQSCGIDWVICGGESGSGAREMKIEWARSVKDECAGVGIPFFYKQGPGDDGAFIKMPLLDGRTWAEMPEGNDASEA